jgi:hypothetical protein
MDNAETLTKRRDNQEWTMQRHCQHEGTIKNGQCRDTGHTKGQSRMDNAETLATRRDNQEWTMQRHWQHEGTIKNGQCRDTVATLGTQDTRRRQTKQKGQSRMDNAETLWQHWVHKTQDEDKQNRRDNQE